MPGPPPPPPPPPIPGFSGSGPPPPPPPPGGLPNSATISARPPAAVAKDRGALLTDITKGAKLKKAVTNDRSAPIVGKVSVSIGPPTGGAPAVPRPQGSLAPPVPNNALSRGRSNSDSGGAGSGGGNSGESAPQLGGIFAGIGIPKLKRTGGGIDTGADRDSSYLSEPEISRASVPRPPFSSAPKPPTAPRPSGLRPVPQTTESSPSQLPNAVVPNFRKPPLKPVRRPSSDIPLRSKKSALDVTPPRAPPPPLPGTLKPPPPPITSRKPSIAAPSPPNSIAPKRPAVPPPTPSITPRPPESIARPPPTALRPSPSVALSPPSAPPPPPIPAPRTPPSRSTPPPPESNNIPIFHENPPSLAMQAARNAFGNGSNSPAAPPPPPPPSSSPLNNRSLVPSNAPPLPSSSPIIIKSLAPSNPPSAPPQPPTSRPAAQQPNRPLLDPSSFTLSNGNSNHTNANVQRENEFQGKTGMITIQDDRWHFQDESLLPKPRDFVGGPKKYRAGRGSSVPLDLSLYR